MTLNLKNHTALVTGASQGIGKEIALELAKQGASVVITSNDQAMLKQTALEIEALGANVLAVLGDAKSELEILNIVNQALEHYQNIDILVNNVGHIGRLSLFEELSTAEWHDIFQLNVMSAVHFTKAVLPSMKKQQWGRIIFISSEKATEPGTHMSHYSVTKTALVSLAKSLANEIGQYGVTVNSISPGVILTPAWNENARSNNLTPEEYAAQWCKNVLSGQNLGKPKDVASFVAYLCSESARWMTGSNFRIDGGSVKSIQI